MHPELLEYLCCPACQQPLSLSNAQYATNGEIIQGALECQGCARRYPIRAGIADFLPAPRPPTIAQVTNEMPLTAWAYERIWRPYALSLLSGTPLSYSVELPRIVEWSAAAKGGLIVDLACSNGLYARHLAQAIPTGTGLVVGIDHALPMLLEARKRIANTSIRVSYLRASAQQIPLATQAVASVVVGGSLNEIGNLAACLAEVRRVLAKDGRFVTMTLTSHPKQFEHMIQRILAPSGIQFWKAAELIMQFEQAGLPVEEQLQQGIVLFTRSRVSV